MADKFQTLFPIEASFFKGESPTPAKLEGVFTQISAAFDVLELALGDMWHKSQDGSSPLDPLYTVNLSRTMGDMALINPAIFSGTVNNEVEIVTKDSKVFALTYAPQTPSAVSFNDATVFQTYVASRSLVVIAGDYHVDSVGRVYTFLPTHASNDTQADYDYETVGDSNASATFNVIPDPHDVNQTAACTAGTPDGGGFQIITLPIITDVNHPNYSDQLTLPQLLSGMTTGAQIPSGFIKLWDNTNDAMVDSVAFYKESGLNTVKAKATSALDTASDRYSLITVGSSITSTLQFLRDLIYSHAHSDNVTPFIHHEELLGIDVAITHGTTSDIVGKDDAQIITNKEHFRPIVQDDDPTPVSDVLINVIDGEVHFYDKNDFATQASEIGFKTPRTLHLDSIPTFLTGKDIDTVDGFDAYPYNTPTNGALLALDGSAEFPNNVLKTGHGNGLDSDTIDTIHASSTPTASKLLSLDGSAKFPNSVLNVGDGNGLDADTVDGVHASGSATLNKLFPLDGSAKFPNSVLYTGTGNGLDADTVDGKHAPSGLIIGDTDTQTLTNKGHNLPKINSTTTTDITSEQLETLSDGSNADSLHVHTENVNLGSWSARSVATTYQAATDGFVVGILHTFIGYTDSSTPPTTQRVFANDPFWHNSFCLPVKKDDYYKITGGGTPPTSIYWIPLGV